MAVKGDIVLQPEKRAKLDSIVTDMVKNREPDDAIQAVVTDFKSKYGQKGTVLPSATQASEKKVNTSPPTDQDIINIKQFIGAATPKPRPTPQQIQESIKKEKPLTEVPVKQKEDTPEHIDQQAHAKLDEIMYADDSRWKDPLKSVYQAYFNSNDKERAVINRAADLTQRSIMQDGFEAKKLLQSSHFGKEGDDNITARELRNKAQEYDKTTAPLREIQLQPESYDENENAKKVYSDMIQNAAIKWWADKNPDFKRQLGGANVDINDPDLAHRIDPALAGMIRKEYLDDGNVKAYLDKENPHMLPAAEYAYKNNITANKAWGVNQVANEVSQEIQKSGYNKIEPIFNYWGKGSQEYANLTAETMYADDPVKLEIYNKNIRDNQHEYLDAPSFFQGVSETAKDFITGVGHTLTTPFTSREHDIKEEWRKEAMNVSANPDGYIGFIRDTGRATGFVMSLAAGGELLQGAKIVSNPVAAQKVLVGLGFFGDELRKGEMKYDSPVKAWSSAALNTAGFVMLNDIFPAAKARAAFNEVSPELSAIMENLTNGKITKEVARKQANNTFKKAVDFGTKTLAQNAKISLEMTALTAGSKLVDKVLGLDDTTFEKYHPKDEELQTFKSMFLSNGVVAGLSAYGEINKRNHGLENAWWEAANQPKTYMRAAAETAAKNPQLSKTEIYDNIKFLHETKKHLDQRGIPVEQQKEYLSAAMKQRVMEANVANIPDETMQKAQAKSIKDQQTIKETILKGEPVPDELYQKISVIRPEENKKPNVVRLKTKETTQVKEESTKKLTPAIVVNGKEYTGKDHGEAMDKARAAGENIPDKDTPEGKRWRFEHGMFKERDGDLLTRDQTFDKYGIKNSEELNATPQDIVMQAAQSGAITGTEGEMLKKGAITADQALLEFAKQKYGVSDKGESLGGGGRDLTKSTSISVDEAVGKAYPDKESVIKAITQQESIKEGGEGIAQPTETKKSEWKEGDVIPSDLGRPSRTISKIEKVFDDGSVKVEFSNGSKGMLGSKKSFEQFTKSQKETKEPEVEDNGIDNVTSALHQYKESGDVYELYNNIEGIAEDNEKLQDAVKYFRDELEYDRSISGRHDMEMVEKEFVSRVKKAEAEKSSKIENETKKGTVPVSAESEKPAETKADKTGEPAEKGPGEPTEPPRGPRQVADGPKQEWVAIRKEKMQEIASVKDLYERQSGKKWTEVEEKALSDLQAEYPDKTIYEAARDKVYKMAGLFDRSEDFNPTTADLAQIKYFLAETKERRSRIGDWGSEDDITRLRALDDWKKTNEDLLAISKALNPSEAGRAFGYRQSESMLDPENGLTTRRMELMDAKGGERLTDEEMEWTSEMWDKEKELIEREHQAREDSLKESFIAQVQKLQDEFDKRIKQSRGGAPRTKSEKRENVLKQGGKDFADKLRSGKLKGTYATIPGFPQAVNLVIEAVAQIVEKGATLAQAISDYAKNNDIKDEDAFRENFLDVIEKRDKGNESFDKMKEDVELNKVNGITKEVVKKNYIRDYVNAHVGEHETKDILSEATKGLKEIYPEVTEEQVRDAYLKKGDFKIETKKKLETDLDKNQRSLSRLLKIEKDIDDLRNKKILHREQGNASAERGVDAEIEKRQKALKKEMIAQGKKYSGEDKYKKASYDTRAQAHNDRLSKISKRIEESISKGDLSKSQEAKLRKLKDQVDASKVKLDPDSRLSQKDVLDHGLTVLKNIQAEFNKSVKAEDAKAIGDYRRNIQSAIDMFGKDKEESEQNIKLQRTKDNLRSGNDEVQRQINAGEFQDEPPVQLTKGDAELVKLQVERNKLDAQYRAKEKEITDKNKSFIQKSLDVVRGAYVFSLIYKFGTLAKVATAAALRPNIEALTKLSFGNVAKLVFPKEIIKQAMAGGESSSWRSVGKMYAGLLRQMGPEKLAQLYEKANAKFEASDDKYRKAKDNPDADAYALQKLKNERDNDLLSAVGNIMYQYMGGSSIKDAIDALLHRSNVIEREFGFLDKETIKDGTVSDKINYILGFMGRSHSALKTFSGRAGFAGSFMARLEAAQMDGIDISSPDVQLKLAKDAYIDWDRGKYQQGNFVSDAWNHIIQKLDKSAQGESWEKYYKGVGMMLRFDVAITRVPVNILHESVAEYAVGAFRAFYDAANQYRKAKNEVMINQDIMPKEKEFKEAVKKELANMDSKQAATIVRCFRKGGFGLGMFALLAIGGLMKYGGFHHKGEKKKTEEKEAGELDPGEVMVGDTRVGKMVSKIIEHTPSLYPALLGLNSAKIYQDKIDEGKETFDGAMGSLISDLEEMQDAIPQSEIIKPLTLAEKVTTGSMHQLDKMWEWNDVDEDGNLVERKPLDFRDEMNMLFNHRDQVLTKENYAIAKSILSDFKTAIREAHKAGQSKDETDELKRDRDEQIKQIYELNAQMQ